MPQLIAISSTARDLFLLLRCVGFASRALVQISENGLRFTVEDSRIMQGTVVLDKQLFTSYRFDPAHSNSHHPAQSQSQLTQDEEPQSPPFAISLTALLETLQIFGFAENKERWSSRTDNTYSSGIHSSRSLGMSSTAFDSRTLGMTGLCRLSYNGPGSNLCITLEESNVTTTCELTTYEPETIMGNAPTTDTDDFEIPFDRNTLTQKVIMRASLLHDAIAELTTTSPDRLTIVSSPKAPYFSLSSVGPLGSATVDFNKDATAATAGKDGAPGPQLLETFQVAGRRVVNTYKFSVIRATAKAMAVAEKVSIRTDAQGVLSLQFMVQLEGGHVTFVDFRFVPYVDEDGDADADEETDEVEAEAEEDEHGNDRMLD